MFLPRSVGGPETSPLVAFHAIEELSKADGSVGWCVMIASDISLFTGWLKPEITREMCGQPACLRAAGSLRPLGRAYPVDGGYRVKGQWNFASGIHNANWLYCPCILMDGDKPLLTAAVQAAVRAMWLPAKHAAIKDMWSVMGLRGTGSQDFLIDDVFVAQDYTCFLGDRPYENGPLFRPRMLFTFLFTLNAAHGDGDAAVDRGTAAFRVRVDRATGVSGVRWRTRRANTRIVGDCNRYEAIVALHQARWSRAFPYGWE
jgi:hypothetical protein